MLASEQIKTHNLEDLIKRTDQIYTKFTNDFIFEDLDQMRKLYEELANIDNMIKIISKDISNALNKSTDLFNKRLLGFRKKLNIINELNCPDSFNDNYDPVISDTNMMMLITPDKKYEQAAPGIKLPVIHVEAIKDMPNYNLYYITNLAQFAIKINGCLFRGNVGNIISNSLNSAGRRHELCSYTAKQSETNTYSTSKIDKKSSFALLRGVATELGSPTRRIQRIRNIIMDCHYKEKCTYLNDNECTFYHDPIDYNDFDAHVLSDRLNKKVHIRNFLAQSWIYTPEPQNLKNKHMRHVGSRDNLIIDIPLISDLEKRKFKDQTIHDILVTLSIDHVNRLDQHFYHFKN